MTTYAKIRDSGSCQKAVLAFNDETVSNDGNHTQSDSFDRLARAGDLPYEYDSAKVVVPFTTSTRAANETVTLTVHVQESESNAAGTWTAVRDQYSTGVAGATNGVSASATVGAGVAATTAQTGLVEFDISLDQAARYIRVRIDAASSGTATVSSASAVWIFGGGDRDPRDAPDTR